MIEILLFKYLPAPDSACPPEFSGKNSWRVTKFWRVKYPCLAQIFLEKIWADVIRTFICSPYGNLFGYLRL